MNTGAEQDHDRERHLRPDHLRVGQAEERDQAEHERHAHHQRDEGREEHAHALGHEGHQAPARPVRLET